MKNDSIFNACQRAYDNMEHPDYWDSKEEEDEEIELCCKCGSAMEFQYKDKHGYPFFRCSNCTHSYFED